MINKIQIIIVLIMIMKAFFFKKKEIEVITYNVKNDKKEKKRQG